MEYLIICFVCLVVYFPAFKYEPVVDDVSNRLRRSIVAEKRPLWNRFVRRLDGQEPFESVLLDRCVTFGLHLAVCLLMQLAFNNLAASLLFSVNISNNQVSLWMNGKRYAVNTIVCLLMYITPFAIPLWFLTPYFQVSAMSFPLALAILKGYWFLIPLVPLALFVGRGYLIKWAKGRIDRNLVKELSIWNWKKLNLIGKTFIVYFARGLYPCIPSMYVDYLRYCTLRDKDTKEAFSFDWVTLLGFLLVCLIPVIYFLNPVLGFGLVWWLITIAIFSNWITITVFFGERYMYLPNIGLMLFFATLLNYIHPYAWLIVFGLYVGRLISYMPMYKDLDAYFEHHLYTDPKNDNGWHAVTAIASAKKDNIFALQLTERAIRVCKDSPRIWISRGSLLNAVGCTDEALRCLKKAEECLDGNMKDILLPIIKENERLIKEK